MNRPASSGKMRNECPPQYLLRSDKEPGAGARSEADNGLQMAPELIMLDLVRKAMKKRWKRSTEPCAPVPFGKTARSCHRRFSTGSLRSGSASSIITRSGTAYARPWMPLSGSGRRLYGKAKRPDTGGQVTNLQTLEQSTWRPIV